MDTINLSPQHFTLLRLVSYASSITAVLASRQETSDCPLCHQPSTRLQSRYVRSLRDLPWQGDRFAAWMHDVEQTGCPELPAFVASLRKVVDAVHMGLTLTWSQGAVEGHVHRIKFIKRSGYGRMNFATLRQRVLIRPAN